MSDAIDIAILAAGMFLVMLSVGALFGLCL